MSTEALAHQALGWTAMLRKQDATAEREFKESLRLDPDQAIVDYQLGNVLRTQKVAEKSAEAIFYFARAATFEGPNALTSEARKRMEDYVAQAYAVFTANGDAALLERLKNQARTLPFPSSAFSPLAGALDSDSDAAPSGSASIHIRNQSSWGIRLDCSGAASG